MQLETYSITLVTTVLASAGVGMVITSLLARKKTKAETFLLNTETYSTMLGDLRAQINMQGDQIKNQAEQITALQQKEAGYLKLINSYESREKDYRREINGLKKTLTELQLQLKTTDNA